MSLSKARKLVWPF